VMLNPTEATSSNCHLRTHQVCLDCIKTLTLSTRTLSRTPWLTKSSASSQELVVAEKVSHPNRLFLSAARLSLQRSQVTLNVPMDLRSCSKLLMDSFLPFQLCWFKK
jgi:hypothetical protein